MKLWIGGELEAEIGENFRLSRNIVEKKINEFLKTVLYKVDFSDWDCIAIVRNDDNFQETYKYSKKKKEMDIRLKIDFNQFKTANHHEQESLIFKMLQRSLEILKNKVENTENLELLIKEFTKFGIVNNWD
ncbi:Imm44 family immunity protein [Leptospira kanakyensis]|uniref:Uncharacterized protein n=1 Tax=Leptospira kanakyensis TaxID=2484968 RepID=A0A6N4QGX8_9LEPT|nr:Imm44 family immunity protein [Leptospira kanakyensis]MCW7471769.1 Imm44 family immunity protein [Leptospira kanakyensis]MCW7483324.1 Imm44 family immunity protein [Leptospira kanakyensis]TGK46266.1 hypothetical protein EHQ11_18955 [Leptospira kanakyensis]TGK71501.1 hypothetical protein EHQ18_08240 [Leptospira kanakyensis]